MRLNLAILASLLLGSVAAGVVDPEVRSAADALDVADDEPIDGADEAQVPRDEASIGIGRSARAPLFAPSLPSLWKRRGGGGGGGRGGGGGGGSRGGGSRGGGSRGGSSGGSRGGGSGGSGGRSNNPKSYTNTRSSSNVGGYSRPGTGPQPSFMGGTTYGGGSKVPYASGKASPSGVQPRGPVAGSGIGYWPGSWPAPVYVYGPYGYHYGYYNHTSRRREEREIVCGCAEHRECMCDEIKDDRFWDELVGDGDYGKLNKSLVDVTKRKGKTTLVVNGTLPNGTTAKSLDEDDYKEYLTNAAARAGTVLGTWALLAWVGAAVYLV